MTVAAMVMMMMVMGSLDREKSFAARAFEILHGHEGVGQDVGPSGVFDDRETKGMSEGIRDFKGLLAEAPVTTRSSVASRRTDLDNPKLNKLDGRKKVGLVSNCARLDGLRDSLAGGGSLVGGDDFDNVYPEYLDWTGADWKGDDS